jgi:hypothetical protein
MSVQDVKAIKTAKTHEIPSHIEMFYLVSFGPAKRKSEKLKAMIL